VSTTKLSEVINQHRRRFSRNAAMALAAAPIVAMASAGLDPIMQTTWKCPRLDGGRTRLSVH
jgi:hypothetical protein